MPSPASAGESATRLRFAAARYLSLPATQRIRAEVEIEIAARAYPPALDDLKRDWVASVAAPAFAALAQRRPADQRVNFCAIGTGTGVDALAAIELLGVSRVAVTDLYPDVVAAAEANIRANLADGVAVEIHAAAGDLLSALPASAGPFDITYENLPNLPVDSEAKVAVGRTSGAHLAPRAEPTPAFVERNHLTLHYLALTAARDWLAADGVALTTVGARAPLTTLFDMSRQAGYRPSALTFGWKLQADADELIATHAAHQARGFGPFHFYEAGRLAAVFADIEPATAGPLALDIEAELKSAALDAGAALAAHRRGIAIGHTYAVIASELAAPA